MEILGISCSPRKGGATETVLETLFDLVARSNPELGSALFRLSEKHVSPCDACEQCSTQYECSIEDDYQELVQHYADPDLKVVIMATPVYFGSVNAQAKAVVDRGMLLKQNMENLSEKSFCVIAVGASRHGGQELAIQVINLALQSQGMNLLPDGTHRVINGVSLWADGRESLFNDAYGMAEIQRLADRIVEYCSQKTTLTT